MALPKAPKLRLAPLWPALAALAVAGALSIGLLPSTLGTSAAEELVETVQLVRPAIPAPARFDGPDDALQSRLHELARGTGFRLTAIALDGKVLADSDRSTPELARMDNHLARPEVASALARGRGHAVRQSDTTGLATAYAALLVREPSGEGWILRLGQPLAALARTEHHLRRSLALAAAVALVLLGAVSWWLQRRLFRPLADLIAAADSIGHGNYGTAVEIPDQPELARLGSSLAEIARRAEAQLRAVEAERDHLGATVAGMAEGVLVTDRRGGVRLLNPAFRALLGVDREAAPAEVLDLAREPRLGDLIARTLAERREQTAQIERLEPARRLLALVASPLAGDAGAVVVARDITEAERLNQTRRDFVANVSHELKTPLAAIRGYAETLADGAIDHPETALRFSQRIVDQCHRLSAVLADLLTLSRLENREPLDNLEAVELRDLVHEAIELVAGQAGARQVAVTLAPGASPVVWGDAEGLVRLLSNLLENAVKYNRQGGSVTVSLGERAGQAQIEVRDTGIGIPPAALPRIFERFYRVDKGRSREEGGTGLGLAIVKHVAQAHQGRVEVESELGVGSTFRVVLPTRQTGSETRPGG